MTAKMGCLSAASGLLVMGSRRCHGRARGDHGRSALAGVVLAGSLLAAWAAAGCGGGAQAMASATDAADAGVPGPDEVGGAMPEVPDGGGRAQSTDTAATAAGTDAAAPRDAVAIDASINLGGDASTDTAKAIDASAGDPGVEAADRPGPIDGGDHDGTTARLRFTEAPTLVGSSNPRAPLAALLGLQTSLPASASVTISGGGETWVLSLPATSKLRKPIVGVKPATAYTVQLVASTDTESIVAEPLHWQSPALPSTFPPVSAPITQPAQMEPGMTLFNVRVGWAANPALGVIVDATGVVRWYYQGDRVMDDIRRLANGNFLFTASDCLMEEIDILGNTVRAWRAARYPKTCEAPTGTIPVAVDTFHHEVSMLPDGNLLVLSTELRTIPDYPTSDSDASAPTKATPVVTCVVVELSPDGEILKYIPINDLLDPTRVGQGVFERNWALLKAYDTSTAQVVDWDHANSVVYDEASDSYYVSLRMQDAIVKINRTHETLTWILGTPANWQEPWRAKLLVPTSPDLVWPYHQHAAKLTSRGLILYDNGHYRASAYETPQAEWSRAVIFAIDEAAGTVSEAWSYGAPSGPDFFYSSAMGDADLQPGTGNVLFVNSMVRADGGAHGEIVEVRPDGTRVFDLTVQGVPGSVYNIYRADRIADIRK